MNRLRNVLATATTAVLAAGCSEPSDRHVGEAGWAALSNPATSFNSKFDAGAPCYMQRGAQLVLRGGSVYYEHPPQPELGYESPAGTECPNGAQLNVTQGWVGAQDRQWQDFVAHRTQVTAEISSMGPFKPEGEPVTPDQDWVTLVNPNVVGGREYDDGRKYGVRQYGDECVTAFSKAYFVGRLSTGQGVMLLTGGGMGGGSTCPEGALYLQNPIQDQQATGQNVLI